MIQRGIHGLAGPSYNRRRRSRSETEKSKRAFLIMSHTNGGDRQLTEELREHLLAKGADLLVAHHAIREQANPVARNLHMPPSEIGMIAARAEIKQLVLSHRMRRTLGHEAETTALIREHYQAPLSFADDLQCFRP